MRGNIILDIPYLFYRDYLNGTSVRKMSDYQPTELQMLDNIWSRLNNRQQSRMDKRHFGCFSSRCDLVSLEASIRFS